MAGGTVIFSSLGFPMAWVSVSAIQERNALIERPILVIPHLYLQSRQDCGGSQQAEIRVFQLLHKNSNLTHIQPMSH